MQGLERCFMATNLVYGLFPLPPVRIFSQKRLDRTIRYFGSLLMIPDALPRQIHGCQQMTSLAFGALHTIECCI